LFLLYFIPSFCFFFSRFFYVSFFVRFLVFYFSFFYYAFLFLFFIFFFFFFIFVFLILTHQIGQPVPLCLQSVRCKVGNSSHSSAYYPQIQNRPKKRPFVAEIPINFWSSMRKDERFVCFEWRHFQQNWKNGVKKFSCKKCKNLGVKNSKI